MDAETLIALKGSIRKWEKIVAGEGKDDGASNCPLCQRFNTRCTPDAVVSATPGFCGDCPVKLFTGQDGCEDTPYDRIQDVDEDIEDSLLDEDELKAVAQAELAFLKALLPGAGEQP